MFLDYFGEKYKNNLSCKGALPNCRVWGTDEFSSVSYKLLSVNFKSTGKQFFFLFLKTILHIKKSSNSLQNLWLKRNILKTTHFLNTNNSQSNIVNTYMKGMTVIKIFKKTAYVFVHCKMHTFEPCLFMAKSLLSYVITRFWARILNRRAAN